MKEASKTSKKILKTAASAIIRREMKAWPPECFGFSYQPTRPKKQEVTKG